MKLENVVPWGRNLEEYRAMGLFTPNDAKKKILGCGDGPASVNAELTKLGVDITSIDPIYQFSKKAIQKRVEETSVIVAEELRKNRDDFVWKNIADVDALVRLRLRAMDYFLDDYSEGKKESRYRHEELPQLAFKDKEFDLAWSSHFLFLYSEHFDLEFHKKALLEMLRVADEVRVFPLFSLRNEKSPHLQTVLDFLEEQGFFWKIKKSEYEFQKGAYETLYIYTNG